MAAQAATAIPVPYSKSMPDFDLDEVLSPAATVEEALDREITELIAQRDTLLSTFRPVASAYRRSRRELTALKLALGEKLHAMKSELATKGRAGRWADYLRKWNNFPRTSADRYIANYLRHKNLAALINRPGGAFSENVPPNPSEPSTSIDSPEPTTTVVQPEVETTTRTIARETLKEISLRLNDRDHATFTSAVEQLSKKFETKGLTKTVFAAVMHCLQAVEAVQQ